MTTAVCASQLRLDNYSAMWQEIFYGRENKKLLPKSTEDQIGQTDFGRVRRPDEDTMAMARRRKDIPTLASHLN